MIRTLLTLATSLLALGMLAPHASAGQTTPGSCPAALDFDKRRLAGGEQVNLCREYLGSVILVVNTASKCGFTHQYEGLEALYRKYREQGFVVLGFPSNDFGGQEPGTEKEIQKFCRLTYGVQFPMFEKTHAAAANADPLYRALAQVTGEYPRWNFHKYLIDRNGRVVASFGTRVPPESAEVVEAIERLL